MLILFLQIALILVTCRLFGYLGRRAGQAQAMKDHEAHQGMNRKSECRKSEQICLIPVGFFDG